jgi:2-oxoglutarate dehydrogenase E1 component
VASLDFANRANADYIDALYRQYLRDPGSVDERWALFFAGFDLRGGDGVGPASSRAIAVAEQPLRAGDLIHAYRAHGHLIADLDPLGHNEPSHPLLEISAFGFDDSDLDRRVEFPEIGGQRRASLRALLGLLRSTYCGTLAVEYLDISDVDQRTWLQEHLEPGPARPVLTAEDRRHLLRKLVRAEVFERFLHTKFVGQKRFSLEGADSLVPVLDALVEDAARLGVDEMVLGMAHRGRLNVLANIVGKPYEMILAEFEGAPLPRDVQGDGDVKYHLGYSRVQETRGGRKIDLSLSFNPSHLEAVNPVVEGMVRAKQRYRGDTERSRVVPVLIHGDAAFTGQGLVLETLALSELEPYRTGGTIHLIINNQIGFTTSPRDYRFSRYPSDVAKAIQAPVFHVNGDDPEAAVLAARLAIAFRQHFKVDVIIDLVCYRRLGHNEADEPAFTQPILYQEIARHPTALTRYRQRLVDEGVVSDEEVDREIASFRDLLGDALDYARDFHPRQQILALGGVWQGMTWAGDDWSAQTEVAPEMLARILEGAQRTPEGFTLHPKLRRRFEEQAEMLRPGGRIDWATGEMLALGSLLLEGTHVRLAGQDTGRGTFSHRHAVLRDARTNERYVPLDHLAPDQARFDVIDTMLSEAAVLGFEYGFSLADPRNLVIWEAQFGDFANGAQVIIDQFLASGESKWQRMSGLVLLLPHGYEGQGPEHSSARLERFLSLCAEDNLQVGNLTTPAQYFHALRRQIHRPFRKPLVLMTPKSLLRHKLVVSSLEDLTRGTFQPVLGEGDPIDPSKVRRVLLCSGKVFYDLLIERRHRGAEEIAIVRLEQFHPFPSAEIALQLRGYPAAREVFWVQEEPWNMGAWPFLSSRLPRVLQEGQTLSYVGRKEAASPAAGVYKQHEAEQADLVERALRRSHAR